MILLVHGLGEHSGRYVHVGEYFAGRGMAVLSFDLRGHGRSEGAHGHTPSFEKYMDDIDMLVAEADRRYPGIGRFLYGHSLGGILVLNYALRRKPSLNGVISSGPALRTSIEEQALKVNIARIFGSWLPGFQLSSGLEATSISRDPQVVERYQNDPLVHFQVSFGFAKYSLEAIEWTFEHGSEFAVPLLLIHGSDDKLAYIRGSQELAELVEGDCTLKIYDGLYHELHNEPEKEQVLSDVLEWIEERLLIFPSGTAGDIYMTDQPDFIEDILSSMTLEEKVSLMAGATNWTTSPVERMGIPAIKVTDGPNGAARSCKCRRCKGGLLSGRNRAGVQLEYSIGRKGGHRLGAGCEDKRGEYLVSADCKHPSIPPKWSQL